MERRLLETIEGIRIYAKAPVEPPRGSGMVVGRRGRFEPRGNVYEVDHVTSGAAYLHRIYDPPLERVVGEEELAIAVSELLCQVEREKNPSKAYVATRRAVQASRGFRRILVHRGPGEPGISRSSLFCEVIQ